MKYKELLDHEELNITKDQLRRYRQFGLIMTKLTSGGKSAGVKAEMSKITVDVVKEINELKSKSYIKNVEEIIFNLFIKGYPVSIKVLKKKLRIFAQRILGYLTVTFEDTQDEYSLYFGLKDYLKKTSLNKHVGRPTKSSEEALKKEVEKEIEQIRMIQPFLQYFLGLAPMDSKVIQLFLKKQYGVDIEKMPRWANQQYWLNLIDNSTEADFIQILHLWNLNMDYFRILEENQERLPRGKAVVDFIKTHKWLERTELIKLFILIMNEPHWRNQAIVCLEDTAMKKIWLTHWEGR